MNKHNSHSLIYLNCTNKREAHLGTKLEPRWAFSFAQERRSFALYALGMYDLWGASSKAVATAGMASQVKLRAILYAEIPITRCFYGFD